MKTVRGWVWGLSLIFASVTAPGLTWANLAPQSAMTASRPHASGVRFEPNQGQAPSGIRYVGRGAHTRVSLLDTGAIVEATQVEKPSRVRMTFVGAQRGAETRALDKAESHSNYLVGRDASKWVRDVPNYGQVRYAGLYPAVDLVYYGNRGELEYDLVVMPGGDPSAIRMRFDGAHRPAISKEGDLLLDGTNGSLRLHRPVVYQNTTRGRKLLAGKFVMIGAREVGFHVSSFDTSRPLVIDPSFKLLYSSYLGGVHDDQSTTLVLDAQNNSYVVGNSGSEDFPVSASAFQADRKNLGTYVRNVVVTKFSPSGALLYSTFLGGSVNDFGRSIAVDSAGNAYITGTTYSPDFPTTTGAFQPTRRGGNDVFVAVLGPDGSTLRFSTLYGATANSEGNGIRLRDDKIYVGGIAGSGLTTTTGAYKPTLATGIGGFVAIFDPARTGAAQLVAATYYGTDTPAANNLATGVVALDLALAPDGSAWIGGQAYTNNIPTTSDALKPTLPALNPNCQSGDVPLNGAAYVAHLSADLRSLVYATYLSGEREHPSNASCSEYIYSLQTDGAGNLYIHGATASGTFPVTAGAYQATFPGSGGFNGYVGFASKLSADGHTLLWSTYVGGNGPGGTFAGRTVLDSNGGYWLTGTTAGGTNFPSTTDAFQPTPGGNSDAYVMTLDAETGALRYASYFGGSGSESGAGLGVDAAGTVYLAGYTASINLPVTTTAFQSVLTPNAFDGSDWFFAVMGSGAIAQVLPARAGNAGDVTLSLSGAGFQDGATATLALSGGGSIQSTDAWIAEDGATATFTFALSGAAVGDYALTVNNPDQTSFTRKDAFTVEEGGGSDVSAEVIGRSTVRIGVPSAYDVVVTNSGTADAYGVVLMVRYSNVLQPEDPTLADPFGLGLAKIPVKDPNDVQDYSQLPIVFPSSLDPNVSVVPLLIPKLPAGATASFSFPLKATSESDDAFVEAYVWEPFAESAADLNSAFSPASQSTGTRIMQALGLAMGRVQPMAGGGASKGCVDALVKKAIDKALSKIPGVDCLKDFSDALAWAITSGKFAHSVVASEAFGQLGTATVKAMASCVPVAEVVKVLADLISLLEDAQNIADECKDKAKPKPKPKGSKKKTKPKGAVDPNDKTGPEGDGSAHHYVTGAEPFTYSLAFENLPTATLPAAEVVVTDTLDATKLDLDTLTLGNITIGRKVIRVPAGLDNYNLTESIDASLSVRIQGSLDRQTGVLKFTFVSIDPNTGLPPSDPTVGFLPPDTDGISGQGYVLFTVKPKAGLPNGTEIKNQATVVFDANAPILTPVWTNTIDTAAPSSHVAALPASQVAGAFQVTWSGTDTGAGILTYDVFKADDGGAFALWQKGVTATSASFTGVAGHSYAFYSVAMDGTGNTEAPKTAADTTTSVTSAPSGGGGTGGGSSGGGSSGGGGGGSFDWLSLAVGMLILGYQARRRVSRTSARRRPL